MHGFGSVPEDDETFHAEWERDVFGIVLVLGAQGHYTVAQSRHAVERIPPSRYLNASYFERWLDARLQLLGESGLVTHEQLATLEDRVTDDPPDSSLDQKTRERLLSAIRDRINSDVDTTKPAEDPQFGEADRVRVKNHVRAGHTRCPRYVQRATGTVHAVRGSQPFPDDRAEGTTRYEPLYTVQFDGGELWGEAGRTDDLVAVDLWEPYLESVE